jgi:hypothetical protein
MCHRGAGAMAARSVAPTLLNPQMMKQKANAAL